MLKDVASKMFECDICFNVYKCKKYLVSHRRVHANVFPYQCDQCRAQFRRSDYLLTHKKKHLLLHKCSKCDEGFETKLKLKYHMKIHSSRKYYPCDVCSQLFTKKCHMQKHKGRHFVFSSSETIKKNGSSSCDTEQNIQDIAESCDRSSEFPYQCDVCEQRFSTPSTLRNHEVDHLTVDLNWYKCDLCGEQCHSQLSLNTHQLSHDDLDGQDIDHVNHCNTNSECESTGTSIVVLKDGDYNSDNNDKSFKTDDNNNEEDDAGTC